MERRVSQERWEEKQRHRELARQRSEHRVQIITAKNIRYSEVWIASVGCALPHILDLIMRGGESSTAAPLDIVVYNRASGQREKWNVIHLVKQLCHSGFPELQSVNEQVTHNSISFPTGIYDFMRFHWTQRQLAGNIPSAASDTLTPSLEPMPGLT
jgi:hypothetical protein